MNGSKVTHLVRRLTERFGDGNAHWRSPVQARMWQEEWTRCFGDARFDLVVDFSGYTAFWATLLLHSPAATRSIWLHNDMAAETRRVIRGKMRMRHSLPSVFRLYRQFDAMVSVSAALRDINREYFVSRYGVEPDSFVFATNVVNERRVMEGSRGDLIGLEDHPRDPETDEIIVPDWATQMSHTGEHAWFCSVGRFSTEKNQARLLRAFAQVRPDYPGSRLILVGYGPLREQLEALVVSLGLVDVAFVVGPYSNPFPIVAAADCFVLSSDYEGQPMVLLEAAIVGMPIVSVRFGSIDGALPINTIRVVEQTDDGLAEGMREFLRGEVEESTLDADAYNAAALEEFRSAITHSAAIGVR
jgi:glycosyltransferase involved in cell wall biosynthesis